MNDSQEKPEAGSVCDMVVSMTHSFQGESIAKAPVLLRSALSKKESMKHPLIVGHSGGSLTHLFY